MNAINKTKHINLVGSLTQLQQITVLPFNEESIDLHIRLAQQKDHLVMLAAQYDVQLGHLEHIVTRYEKLRSDIRSRALYKHLKALKNTIHAELPDHGKSVTTIKLMYAT